MLNTGLKLAEIILKPIINNFFYLKETKEIVNDPILDKGEKIDQIKKSVFGLNDNFKPSKFTCSLLAIMLSTGVITMKKKIYQLRNTLMKLDLI